MDTLLEQLPFLHMSIAGALAYLIGSLSTAIIVCKLMKLPDPRTQGSGNPGATNILRFAGKKMALITLFGDALKGLIPILVVQNVLKLDASVVAFTAFTAFLGHLYPIFFRFQGGKGVATAFGCILGLNPLVAVCTLFAWFIILKATKISSLGALSAAVFCPIFLVTFNLMGFTHMSPYIISTVLIMDIMLIFRHKSNIKRLILGEEQGVHK